jgi:P4 family phage/plasmid primase-like protien
MEIEKQSKDEILKKIPKEKKEEKDIAKIFSRIGQAEAYIEKNPMFYDRSGIWWKWNFNEFRYEVVDETDMLNSITDELGVDIINSKARTEIVNSLKSIGRRNIPKEIKETWIQFKDTIFDIETGERFQATPEYWVTNPIPYKLHNENLFLTPTMDRIFEEWVGKEYVQTLYEIIAYCLLPSYPLSRIFCFVGAGMNGKSKFLELLRKFVGEKNCCSTELDSLITSRFEITRLYKKLVCQMGETNFNEMDRTSMLKKLTGGDLIGFEFKQKMPFEDKNYAKIIIATNNLPTTTDKTIGFYRRWMIIDFPNVFSEAKDILAEIPEEEYECLALKCTMLLNDLLKKRNFHKEGTIEERKEKYEAKSDFLQKFLDDFTKPSLNEYISKADFLKKFKDWCYENRHRAMAENTLGKLMKEKGVETGRKYMDWLYDGKGGQIWVWDGIQWK